jgi:hypothetical protein
MPIPSGLSNNCSMNNLVCQDPNTGNIWPEDFPLGNKSHCMDCQVSCTSSGPVEPSGGFCNTNVVAVDMWMFGFQFSNTRRNGGCLVYLFPEWVLDSQVKFAFACIGTFALGIVVASLNSARRYVGRYIKVPPLQPGHGSAAPTQRDKRVHFLKCLGRRVALATVHAVQLTLAYFLMLVAMTYQAELFIMIPLGLATGHALFDGDGSDGGEDNVDPCCQLATSSKDESGEKHCSDTGTSEDTGAVFLSVGKLEQNGVSREG